jgi:urease accessory protein
MAVLAARRRGYRLTWVRNDPPVGIRDTPDGVYLVATSATPVNDDNVRIQVYVERNAALVVRSAASTVAWATSGSVFDVDVVVEPGGSLDWHLQPFIASARCSVSQRSHLHLSEGATLRWAEEVVLGRSGEGPGVLDLRLDVTVDGKPLLCHELAIGPDAPGWDGPGVLGANRAVGLVLLVGRGFGALSQSGNTVGDGWAILQLDGPGILITAARSDYPALREAMALALAQVGDG